MKYIAWKQSETKIGMFVDISGGLNHYALDMHKCLTELTKNKNLFPTGLMKIEKELEVNKCAFTFSSEIRQIQCTRTEFWCVQCPRPAGPSALDKHQIQASALDLSYFTSKSKCAFINLIHTRQKNKIICSCSWKIINKMVLKCH